MADRHPPGFAPYEKYLSTQVAGLGMTVEEYVEDGVRAFENEILPLLPTDRDTVFLEIGCGCGRNLLALRRHGYNDYQGVDASPEEVSYAQGPLGLANVSLGDCLTFLKDSKPAKCVVLLLDILEHLDDSEAVAVLSAARAVMLQGSMAVIRVPNGLAPLSPWRYADFTHRRAYTPWSISQSLALAGFDVSTLRHFPSLAPSRGRTGRLRAALWWLALTPSLRFFTRLAYGSDLGGIYTANIISAITR